MKIDLRLVAAVLAGTIGEPQHALASTERKESTVASSTRRRQDAGFLPTFRGTGEWLNSPPLTPESLRGKVVLIDFWTYSCINWLRSYPYVRAWSEKYKDKGLVVIGVHSPEFEFEKDIANIRWAVQNLGVQFPVVVDSDRAIWRAFNNRYWPALYLVDAQGRIRFHHFGEGEYEQSEKVIQQLLSEAGSPGFDPELVAVEGQGIAAPADWRNLASPETYLGSDLAERFVPTQTSAGAHPGYATRMGLRLNEWTFTGQWKVGRQSLALGTANGRLVYRFHARDLHLVMGPAVPGADVRFRVLIDGQPPGAAHGLDVDELGNGRASLPRLYQLIRQPAPIVDRLFEIEFLDPGIETFSFTSG